MKNSSFINEKEINKLKEKQKAKIATIAEKRKEDIRLLKEKIHKQRIKKEISFKADLKKIYIFTIILLISIVFIGIIIFFFKVINILNKEATITSGLLGLLFLMLVTPIAFIVSKRIDEPILYYLETLKKRNLELKRNRKQDDIERSNEKYIRAKAIQRILKRPKYYSLLVLILWYFSGIFIPILNWQISNLSLYALIQSMLIIFIAAPSATAFSYLTTFILSRNQMRQLKIDFLKPEYIFKLKNKLYLSIFSIVLFIIYMMITVTYTKAYQLNISTVEPYIMFRTLSIFMIGIIIFSILYLWIALWLITENVSYPISELQAAMKEVENGNYFPDIEIISNDEIGSLVGSFKSMTEGLSERTAIKELFGKYVTKEIRDELLKGNVELGGTERECTILFSDIRSFTKLSEAMEPIKVVEMLNQYFSEMIVAIIQNKGVVDKFIGDAIMAVFGAPARDHFHAEHAVMAAQEMIKRLQAFNFLRKITGDTEIKIGIGINSGKVIAGNIGSEQRMEYTVIGDTVNTASRLEHLTKKFKVPIIISETTRQQIKNNNFKFNLLSEADIRGKEKKVKIYSFDPGTNKVFDN